MTLIRLLQLLFIFWLLVALFKSVAGLFRKRPKPSPPEKTSAGEEMVQDPVCGTYVPRSLAIKEQMEGKTLFFCSKKCRDAYRDSC